MTAEKTDAPADGRLALIALAIGSFGIGTSEFSSMGLMPLFAADLSIDVAKAAHAITAYALGVVVGAPLVTLLASRLNRRTLLIALMGLFAAGNLLSGVAHSLGILIMGRFVSGMPQGAYFGAGAVIATHIVGGGRGGKAFALVVSGVTIATVIGAPIGTFIGQHLGWQTAYLVIAGYALLTMAAFVTWLPKSDALDGKPVSQELAALGNPKIWAMMFVAALCVSSVFAVYTFVGPLVTEVAHLSAAIVPIALGLIGIGMALGTPLGGRLADQYEYRGMLIGFGATLCVLLVLGIFGDNAIILLAGLFAVGLTLMLAIPTIPVRMTHMAPEAPTMMGAMNMASFNIANAIGAAAGSLSISAGFGYLSPIWGGFTLTMFGLIIFFLLFAWFRGR